MIERMNRDGPSETRGDWVARVQEFVGAWSHQVAPLATSEQLPMRPERLCTELTRPLPEDAVLVSDTGHAGIWTGTIVDLASPNQSYIRCAGSLGWGLPAAKGANCAVPDRPVICFIGDAGMWYHLAELETAARNGIDTVTLVNDNASLNQEQALNERNYGGRTPGSDQLWMLTDGDFAGMAEMMGCLEVRVEKPADLDDARPFTETGVDGPNAFIDTVSGAHPEPRRVDPEPRPSRTSDRHAGRHHPRPWPDAVIDGPFDNNRRLGTEISHRRKAAFEKRDRFGCGSQSPVFDRTAGPWHLVAGASPPEMNVCINETWHYGAGSQIDGSIEIAGRDLAFWPSGGNPVAVDNNYRIIDGVGASSVKKTARPDRSARRAVGVSRINLRCTHNYPSLARGRSSNIARRSNT